jgi:predicted Fe-S protein YdhL (DUF1289 family)
MALFPKIQSPCPYKNELASLMEGDICRMCKRQVIDISAWSDDERVAFLKGCSEKVCVSYKFRPAIAAAAIAAAAIAVPAAAAACEPVDFVFVGGITDPANVEYVRDSADSATPELPVLYEDGENGTAQASPENRKS